MTGLFKSKRETVRAETRRRQADAADPTVSAWVSANAGTGKTYVLTQRILRLLLAGTPPERILALTYTKAAAAEMANRVFERLADWVRAEEAKLRGTLKELLGRAPTPEETQRARRLFALAIETPGGLKVQTIHAFCERLLHRFPLEAGVPPGFAILDDHERRALLNEATDDMLAAAAGDRDGVLLASLQTVIAFASEDRLKSLLPEVFEYCRRWGVEEVPVGLERELRARCGVRAEVTGDELTAELSAVFNEDVLPMLVAALQGGSARDAERAENLQQAIGAGSMVLRARSLEDFFLTGKKEPRRSLLTRDVSNARPDLAPMLQRAQDRFVALYAEQQALTVVSSTLALLRLAREVLDRYSTAKVRRAALDFDDLVGSAARLLASSDAVEWVLYKLDGGLDHILVDEGQDTSPVQWQVIRALAEEFFSGAGAREDRRTLFAVGDEKQSIYSFQGAAPTMLAATGEMFARKAEHAGQTWRRVPLTLSFRSVEPLLRAVDLVFAAPARTPGMTAGAEPVLHITDRLGMAGLVEVWPTERPETAGEQKPWLPLEEAQPSSTVVRLAARIADTIEHWRSSGELLVSQNRPIRAGDILILVRKRAPFAAAMVSALKGRGIPVAGADRLLLTEQIAVLDLMALGDVLMLPEDDLALATVLKSPLFGLDDADLLKLAPERKGALWHELMARSAGDARLGAAAATLGRWQLQARRMPPFEFYVAVLDGEGMRARMLARLGAEAADAIEEFLNLALAYDDAAPPSLQGFLCSLREGRREIKRDMEQSRDEVRVMTVHGAKGLEAPIVFLPDTCSTGSGRSPDSPLEIAQGGAFLWPVKGTSAVGAVQQAKAAINRADHEEYNRLLYVALTRARDRLYVAGYEGTKAPPANCWYNLIVEGLSDELKIVTSADGRDVRRLECAQTAVHEASKARGAVVEGNAPLPTWAMRPAPAEPVLGMPLAPSRLAPYNSGARGAAKERGGVSRPSEPGVLSPALLAKDHRFLRGTITHALLEHLPGLPQSDWEAVAAAEVAARGQPLPVRVRNEIVSETLKVLRHPQFAAVFGPGSRAEVAIVAEVPGPDGRGPPLRFGGKIDRLVQQGQTISIVDYKTNRPPPTRAADVAEAYVLQLAAYRLGIRCIFPAAHVRAALLWTDGPQIMEIPGEMLDEAERGLWRQGATSLDG